MENTINPEKASEQKSKKMSGLDKTILIAHLALAVDAVMAPFLTGKSVHEWLGLPPSDNYKIFGERTALMAEQAVWGLSGLYTVFKGYR